jgi:hypothetical protein
VTITINSIVEWFTTAHTMQLLLALLVLGALYTLIQLSRNNNDTLNLSDLVTVNGRLDEKKFSRFGAWVISTWAFVYLIVNGPANFPEWYFIGYMGVWVSNAVFDKYMTSKEMNAETRYRQSSQTYIQDPANRVPQTPQKEL